VRDLAAFRRMLTRARAGVGGAMLDEPAWRDVELRAATLPEDMQGIFLMIARAAKEGAACPGDAAFARAYGTRSLGRARRVLAFIEEQGLIVTQVDGTGGCGRGRGGVRQKGATRAGRRKGTRKGRRRV
jgi:hypothetical protein